MFVTNPFVLFVYLYGNLAGEFARSGQSSSRAVVLFPSLFDDSIPAGSH